MLDRRWWDAAMIAASLAVILAVGLDGPTVTEAVLIASGVTLLAVGYLFVARPGLRGARAWRLPVFTVLAAAAMVAGCSAAPFFAIMQAIAYPMVWVLAGGRRRSILGCAVVAIGVFLGFVLFSVRLDGSQGVTEALGTAGGIAGFGFAFAVAFGLWITSIVEYGEERARLVADLTAAQSEVEALSRERGALDERERLARDLHDTLAQTLAGLAILAERAGRQLADERTDAAADTIATVERLSRDALEEARAIVTQTAAVPSDAALGDAVERLVGRFQREAGLAIDLDVQLDSAGVLTRESQLVLLRCLQEALANVRKHARATRVRVRVSADARGAAVLEVVDDGQGFDEDDRRTGFGLDGMSDRVALAGGEFAVESAAGRGTTLVVRLPPTPSGQEVAS